MPLPVYYPVNDTKAKSRIVELIEAVLFHGFVQPQPFLFLFGYAEEAFFQMA